VPVRPRRGVVQRRSPPGFSRQNIKHGRSVPLRVYYTSRWYGTETDHTARSRSADTDISSKSRKSRRAKLTELHVPAVYLTWANPVFLAFLAFSGMSKLHGISGSPNFDSPHRHHCFAFCFIQLENMFVSRHCRVPFEVAPKSVVVVSEWRQLFHNRHNRPCKGWAG
jgi:hypothetical protein